MGVDYYAVLEIQRAATPEEIRRGYVRTSIRCHPERPYSECPPDDLDLRLKWFQLAGEAYEVLSNPFLRAAYDKFGEAGLKNGVPARDPELFFPPYSYHGDALKTYRDFFGTESPSEPVLLEWQTNHQTRRPDGERGPWFREQPEEVILPLSLEKVMQGGEAVATMLRRELNNGVIEVKEHHFKLDLNPGTPCGSAFRFPKQGHQAPYSIPGDVLVVTKDLPHPVFSRDGADLVVYCKVNLMEALLGCSIQVPALDGRLLRLNVTDVITPKYELRVPGEGMPTCEKVVPPPSFLESPSRKCFLATPDWVKGSKADCAGKIGPCSTCGLTSDCCDQPGTHNLSGTSRTVFPLENPSPSRKNFTLRNSTGSLARLESLGAEDECELKRRHTSFDGAEVRNAREQLLKRFPNLFDSREKTNGDLVIRFKIDYPTDVPGHRRHLVEQALQGLVQTPERRVLFNPKY